MDRFECRRGGRRGARGRGAPGRERAVPPRRSGTATAATRWSSPPLAAVVREDEAAGGAGDRGGAQAGKPGFIPARWEKVYLDWMENIRDWCISRQIWWGHRIPVWSLRGVREDRRSRSTSPSSARACGGRSSRRTRTCSTPGSPRGSGRSPRSAGRRRPPTSKHYYPTSVLVTGFDIIFFWVARMIMMGLEFMGEVPFPRRVHPRARARRAAARR